MEKSLFSQYVDKWFGPTVRKIVEKVNGTENPLTYLHKRMLKRVFSPTLKWGSLSVKGRMIAADVVAVNTPVPLKKRDSIATAEGDIPKMGMKLYLDEKTFNDLDILKAQNTDGSRLKQILQALFADVKKCIVGPDEQIEGLFLQALSSGLMLIEDDKNTGAGFRIDFNHPDANKFGVTAKWSADTAQPLDDIENVIHKAKAKGHIIRYVKMGRDSFNAFRKHAQVRELFAAGLGFAGQNIPVPNLKQVNEILQDNYGLTIEIIDRVVNYEKNGATVAVDPWAKNAVVFLTSEQVGSLHWGRLAEMNHPVKSVDYAIADDFKLISKYSKNDPLQEFTSVQAMVVPVIDEIDAVYIMNCEEATAAEDTQTEGDANYTYEGTDYTKQSVVDGLNATEEVPEATIAQKDATLAKKIDSLSKEGVATFEAKLVAAV